MNTSKTEFKTMKAIATVHSTKRECSTHEAAIYISYFARTLITPNIYKSYFSEQQYTKKCGIGIF